MKFFLKFEMRNFFFFAVILHVTSALMSFRFMTFHCIIRLALQTEHLILKAANPISWKLNRPSPSFNER